MGKYSPLQLYFPKIEELIKINMNNKVCHGSFLEVFRQKNVLACFSMSLSYILSTDSKTVLS